MKKMSSQTLENVIMGLITLLVIGFLVMSEWIYYIS